MFQINMKHHTGAKQWRVLSALLMTSALFFTQQASAAQAFSLQEIIALANQQNPSINIAKAQQDAAIARVTTAGAYLNPEVEASMGPSRYRSGSNETKKNWTVALSQPIEFSTLRVARRSLADSGVKAAGVGLELSQIELKSRVKSAFYDVLQRQAVLAIVEGDRNLLQQIRDKVKSRVDVGEAPKYELIKADTETLAAERDYQAAMVRVIEAKAYLRGFIGFAMPIDYDLKGLLPLNQQLPSLVFMREQLNQSPQLTQIRATAETAEANLNLEQRLRAPGVTLKAGVEQDPDLTSLRFGLAIPLPLWSQRQVNKIP